MKGKKIILGAVIFSLLVFLSSVSAIPALPSFFYGDLSINGEGAKVGTKLVAKINGEERGSIVIGESGKYGKEDGNPKLLVNGDSSDDGKVVVFFVDGIKVDQTGIWKSGKIVKLNLSVEFDEEEGNGDEEDDDEVDDEEDTDDEDQEDDQEDGEDDEDDTDSLDNEFLTNHGNGIELDDNDDSDSNPSEKGTFTKSIKEVFENLYGDEAAGLMPMMITLIFGIFILFLVGVFVVKRAFFS